jgi:hypothetical protein
MNMGFTEQEWSRVRGWLLPALARNPVMPEEEIVARLRDGDWHLLSTEHAAAILELSIFDGEKVATIHLIGGEKHKAMREIIVAYSAVCSWLRIEGFTRIAGHPRKGFEALLKRLGFQKSEQELFKEL